MSIHSYFEAKAVEYKIILERLSWQINNLESGGKHHLHLRNRLKQRIKSARSSLKNLERVLKLSASDSTHSRGLENIHLIEFEMYFINEYLVALKSESSASLALRKSIVLIIQRLGFPWVKDVVVKLDSQLAINPLYDTPLFFIPSRERLSLLEVPGIYHEVGHNFFSANRDTVSQELNQVVDSYISKLLSRSDSFYKNQKLAFKEKVENIKLYWQHERLEELFCDIFATWACGISHYVSCVDMGLLHQDPPHEVSMGTPHPSMASRVFVCFEVLIQRQQLNEITQLALKMWSDHLNLFPESPDHRFICDQLLLKNLTEISIELIQQILPATKQYNELNFIGKSTSSISAKLAAEPTLEEILYKSAQVLLQTPERYVSWESKTLNSLGW
jgi:hypothetical protein